MGHPASQPCLSWSAALEIAAEASGVVALLGAADTGKSTFALAAANRAATAGRRVAVVDADVGQSEIGPPGAIALGLLDRPVGSLTQVRPRGLAFVGDIAPAGHHLSVVMGALAMVRRAREREADLVLVDTSGLVDGRGAEKLKLAKWAAIQPRFTLAFARGRELERLERRLAQGEDSEYLSVTPEPGIRGKSPVFRRARRERQWSRYFSSARTQTLRAAAVEVIDSWLFSGQVLPPHHRKFAAEVLRTPVLHGEETPEGLCLCVGGRPDGAGIPQLQEQFGKRRRLVLSPADAFEHLLVGLVSRVGQTLGLGVLETIDFECGSFTLVTPLTTTAHVAQLWFGRIRVRPDGVELERLAPGAM
jgi:polynucleotide 5'-hydroxyl-kinase GRC3/NOL9